MPVRQTKRGDDRTPLHADVDVLICGASFAGLALARELRGLGADVLVIDRYEIGERQTSACGIPTGWLHALGLERSLRQTFSELVIHSRARTYRYALPWSFSTFDYRELCALLWAQRDPATRFETATVEGREGNVVRTDRGELRARLVVDGLGWRRALSNETAIQPPEAYLSRGLEVHPGAHDAPEKAMELWIDRRLVPAGYGWSFPAADELRIGVGSFDPRFHVKQPTLQLVEQEGREPQGYQGNWIPHKLRPATEDGVFFVGDSAGHCLPLTAEGIRTALYFGLACGRELRAVLEGHQDVSTALRRYGEFSADHRTKFEALLLFQRIVPRLHPRLLDRVLASFGQGMTTWWFNAYLEIAPPRFVHEALPGALAPPAVPVGSLEAESASVAA